MGRSENPRSDDAGNPPSWPRDGLTRRRFSTILASVIGLPFIEGLDPSFISEPDLNHGSVSGGFSFSTPSGSYPLYDQAVAHVIPKDGFRSRIALKNSILKLVEYGVIDRGKFFAVLAKPGPDPAEFAGVLTDPSDRLILLTTANASRYVDLLWPVGLANYIAANAKSPLYGSPVKYASNEGWTLGREESGMGYFDRFPICLLYTSPSPRDS